MGMPAGAEAEFGTITGALRLDFPVCAHHGNAEARRIARRRPDEASHVVAGAAGVHPFGHAQIGGARTSQRTLSEASAELAGNLGLDFVGELLGGVVRHVLGMPPAHAKPGAARPSRTAEEMCEIPFDVEA